MTDLLFFAAVVVTLKYLPSDFASGAGIADVMWSTSARIATKAERAYMAVYLISDEEDLGSGGAESGSRAALRSVSRTMEFSGRLSYLMLDGMAPEMTSSGGNGGKQSQRHAYNAYRAGVGWVGLPAP